VRVALPLVTASPEQYGSVVHRGQYVIVLAAAGAQEAAAVAAGGEVIQRSQTYETDGLTVVRTTDASTGSTEFEANLSGDKRGSVDVYVRQSRHAEVPGTVGVNWAALGTCTPGEAKAYAKLLRVAAAWAYQQEAVLS
jgi:hypothetical protein